MIEKKTASLKDVSAYAKVNISTVSRYLSNELEVKPETEKRILDAIKKTGYQPNYIARALKTKNTYNIGVISPNGSNPLFAEIISGIDIVLRENNYTYFLITTNNDIQQELNGIRLLQSKSADGIIILNSGMTTEIYSEWLKSKMIDEPTIVFVNSMFNCDDFSRVLNDFRWGSYTATQYLLKHGRRRIAMISGRAGQEESDLKRDGYLQALAEMNIGDNGICVLPGFYRFAEGYQMADRIISEFHPDAIIGANDLMAIAAMRCAIKRGLTVPDDIAIIGYGNSEASEFTSPSLSTIDQQKRYVGNRAATLLIELLKTGEKHTDHIDTTFIIRESC